MRPQTAGIESLRKSGKLALKIEHNRSRTELQFPFKCGTVLTHGSPQRMRIIQEARRRRLRKPVQAG